MQPLLTALILTVLPGQTLEPVAADDPFAVRDWAADFFYSERGVVLDEDIDDSVLEARVRVTQLEYELEDGRDTLLVLWREEPADAGDIEVNFNGEALGSIASNPAGELPGMNFALIRDAPPNLSLIHI